jgi:isoleucyl-tRNA synthetase
MFEPFASTPNQVDEELKVLEFWKKNRTFYKSCDQRLGNKEFVFYDGPPFATGLPHHGHLLVSTIKDIVARYAAMEGLHVRRRFGWDCHGLPVEFEIEKKLKISGKKAIEDFGIGNFNDKCRGIVDRYTGEWETTINRLGRWVDFDDQYRTLDLNYMESVWWVFNELWKKDLIYQGHRIQPYCPRCATPLSNFETNQGYRDRQDPSVTITCPTEDGKLTFLIWTTTPWTLPTNTALCVGADIDYDHVEKDGLTYVIASSRRLSYFSEEDKIVKTVKGSDLVGLKYEPLFDFFAQDNDNDGCFTVYSDAYVSDSDGTGIVHLSPAFGEDDNRLGKEKDLPLWDAFDAEVKFVDPVSEFKGLGAKEADKSICKALKEKDRLFKQVTIDHSYPHCWRCDSPLVYRALSAWFMSIEPVKQTMIDCNKTIHWVPGHLRDGRFGKWLEGARDWNLSRNRYWGSPIPIWLCPDGHTHCVGSKEELEKLSGEKIDDLHKHFMDEINFDCPDCKKKMTRTSEVLDCWFESGAMPYAQLHYPFEEEKYFEQTFPADFIAEATDQTRGWFYSLTVLAAALFGKPAFKNVVVNGLLLAEDGKKMSKRLNNYTAPDILMNEFGADPFRLALINSAVVRGQDVAFTDAAVKEASRSIIIPLVNSCQFFLTYAKADNWVLPEDWQDVKTSDVELDRWILSRQQTLIGEIKAEMKEYNLNRMVPPLLIFLDELTNWYIRRSRRRFWKSTDDSDKQGAYFTLHRVLVEFLKALAPVVPFSTEFLYEKLMASQDETAKSSVHLCDYPEVDENLIDLDLERRMSRARKAVNLGHALRKEHELKVRQPLSSLTLVVNSVEERDDFEKMKSLILEELNIKEILYTEDETSLVTLSARPNFKTLGKRLGPKLKTMGPALKNISVQDILKLSAGDSIEIEGESFDSNDILIDRKVKEGLVVGSDAGITVALNPELNDALILEGLAREIVNRLQQERKDSLFEVSDRIQLTLFLPDAKIKEAYEAHKDYIEGEVLAVSTEFSELTQPKSFTIDEYEICSANLVKV